MKLFCRKILKALKHAHSKGVAHGGLADESSYVIKLDKHGVKLMLINFGIQRYGMDDEAWVSHKMNDVTVFCQKLKVMMPTFRGDDSEQFYRLLVEQKRIM